MFTRKETDWLIEARRSETLDCIGDWRLYRRYRADRDFWYWLQVPHAVAAGGGDNTGGRFAAWCCNCCQLNWTRCCCHRWRNRWHYCRRYCRRYCFGDQRSETLDCIGDRIGNAFGDAWLYRIVVYDGVLVVLIVYARNTVWWRSLERMQIIDDVDDQLVRCTVRRRSDLFDRRPQYTLHLFAARNTVRRWSIRYGNILVVERICCRCRWNNVKLDEAKMK